MTNSIKIKWKYQTNECLIRAKILSQVFSKYSELKTKIQLNDAFSKQKVKLIQPKAYVTFYMYFMPYFFFNSNLYIFFKLRKDVSISKYFVILIFNIFSLYVSFFHVDKKIFNNYISKPNPYAKFMREEFLKFKNDVSEQSYKRIEKNNFDVLDKYKL